MKKIYITIAVLLGTILLAQDGTLDPTFGKGGIITIPNLGFPQALYPQEDGKTIIVGKKLVEGNYVSMIARITQNGALDTTFSSDGIATINTPNSEFISVNIDILNNIIVGQKTEVGATTNERIYRFTTNGNLDTTFGSGNGFITAGALFTFVENEKIISAYDNSGTFVIQKFNSNGQANTSFNGGVNKIITVDDSFDVTCTAIVADYYGSNTTVIVTGHSIIGAIKTYKFNIDGTNQSSFTSITDNSLKFARTLEIAEGPSCFISTDNFVSPQRNIAVSKYSNDLGTLDTSFGVGGTVKLNFNNNNVNTSYTTLNQPDNKILVIGKTGTNTTGSFAIARYLSSGILDATFGNAGKTVTASNSTCDFPALGVPSIPDLKLLVIGQSNTTNSGPTGSVQVAKYRTGITLKNNFYDFEKKISISPNPTNSMLNIETQEKINSINLIDLLGKKTNITNFDNNQVDVSNLQNGVYFIEVATEKSIQVQKFIKN